MGLRISLVSFLFLSNSKIDSDHQYRVAESLLRRNFTATTVNKKWVSDITYISTKKGWTYLKVIIGLADRMIVEWNLCKDMTSKNTVGEAFEKATFKRRINKPLLFHSDRGVQYCAEQFKKILSRNKWYLRA